MMMILQGYHEEEESFQNTTWSKGSVDFNSSLQMYSDGYQHQEIDNVSFISWTQRCDEAIILPTNQKKLAMAIIDMEFPQTLLALNDFGVQLCKSA